MYEYFERIVELLMFVKRETDIRIVDQEVTAFSLAPAMHFPRDPNFNAQRHGHQSSSSCLSTITTRLRLALAPWKAVPLAYTRHG